MAEHPLLIFPSFEKVDRHKRPPGFPQKPHLPSGARQVRRLGPKFERLEKTFEKASLSLSPQGIEPEKALVFEIAGGIQEFVRAVEKISGLEWLAESTREVEPTDTFYVQDNAGQKKDVLLPTRLYVVMADQRGARELISLWNRYQDNPSRPTFRYGLTKWRDLFRQLIEVRFWGPKDRLEDTGLREEWEERTQGASQTIRIEIELWFRYDAVKRQIAEDEARRVIHGSEGQVVSRCLIEGIHYHALLIDLPSELFHAVCKRLDAQIVRCDQVMFLRPKGQMAVEPHSLEEISSDPSPLPEAAVINGEPVIALLDGLPIENHVLLQDRLIVDDPEDWATTTTQATRFHGTAMASLIIHGDREVGEAPLDRPIYVRPVIYPNHETLDGGLLECAPPDRLVTDLIHRAVRRIVEGDGDESAVAPSVRIINLSLGDPTRPFLQIPSPWARLLDYLAEKYQLLFIVSAGNYPTLRLPLSPQELERLPAHERARQAFQEIRSQAFARRLLSPAESLNSLTVGSHHSDASTSIPGPYDFELIPVNLVLPAPYSALGFGLHKAIKPELLVPGGRLNFTVPLTSQIPCELRPKPAGRPPGQRAARPNIASRSTLPDATGFLSGTSNSAALTTRAAAKTVRLIEELREEPGGEILTEEMTAVMVKALLVHGASWSSLEEPFRACFDEELARQEVARFLGYGIPDLDRVLACTEQRATLLGCGKISIDQGHRYSVPLPPSLSGRRLERRVTVTLAWLSPVNAGHQRYRQAALELKLYGDPENREQHAVKSRLDVSRQEADWRAVQRGTIQHEVYSGDRPMGFSDGDELHFQISCRADAGRLSLPVSYALAISLEVPEGIEVSVYGEIQARIRPRIMVQPVS